jgi:DNA repair exonuclease SbcCD ATPase subunit
MNRTLVTAITVVLSVLTATAHAQAARSGGTGNAAVLQQLQQVASERTELAAQNAKLQQDLDAMRKERDALKAGQSAADRRAQQTEVAVRAVQQQAAAKQQAADENVARWKTQMDELVAKYRELAQTLRDTESSRTGLQQQLSIREHALGVCTDDNASLYNLNGEVLDHFEHQSPLSGLARVEPFTRVARTRLENAALEYKERASALRTQAAKTATKAGGT